jgi:hypothetical protein
VLIAASLVAAGAALAADDPEPEVAWFAIPNAAYDSDDRFGFGGRAEVAWKQPGWEPYRQSLVVQGYTSITGYHNHYVRFDRLGIGPRERLRVTANLAWRQWKNDGYWGIGNGTVREAGFAGPFTLDDPLRKRYRYSLTQPLVHVVARQDLGEGSPWSLYAAVNPKLTVVDTYDLSILAEHDPYGMDGGFTVLVSGGVVWDSREPERAPRSGGMVEFGGRVAPDLGGEAGGWGGPIASARGFLSLGPRVVVASRVVGEWLLGTVPFYEMVHWGGLVPIQGFGGFETLRGVRFGRWRAPGKAVANLELRIRAADLTVGGAPLGIEIAPLADVGAVWGAGEAATSPAPARPLHLTVGGGLRLIYDEVFVGRVDYGVGWDPVQRPDGVVENRLSTGIYFVFDHPF